MQHIIAYDVIKTLNDSMESELPDMILKVLKDKEGKRFDKRVIDYLNVKIPNMGFRKRDSYSCSSLIYNGNEYGLTFYYNTSDHARTVNTAFIESHNVAYFEARRFRNEQRRALLADEYRIDEIVRANNETVAAYNNYVEKKKLLSALIANEEYSLKNFTEVKP